MSSNETLIHQRAKELISEEEWLYLPPRPGLSDEPFLARFKNIKEEYALHGFRVDVICEAIAGYPFKQEIAIEVCVHSKCSQEKVTRFREHGVEALEIRLPKKVELDLYDDELFNLAVWGEMNNVKNQEWISLRSQSFN